MKAYEFLKKFMEEIPEPKNMYVQVRSERFRLVLFNSHNSFLEFRDSSGMRKSIREASSFRVKKLTAEKPAWVGLTSYYS